MSKLALRVVGLGVVIALLGVGSYAIAGSGTRNFTGSPLNGYEENPDISTLATGSFDARLSQDGKSFQWELSYSGIEGGNVLQAHIHFGKRAVNGGISIFLCTNLGNGPAGTQTCPQSGTVRGEADASDVIGPGGQGIAAGEFDEILAAMRAGHAYANVHSQTFQGGEIRAQINDRGGDRGRGSDG
jgi:hypothetical protein